jgi:transcriptional regulator with XRE-family HTH domain
MTYPDRPLTYWISVARLGFEDDFRRIMEDLEISRTELAQRMGVTPAYISKTLNRTDGNYELGTMAKWARAIGAVLQISLTKEGEEVVRVVDYETAREIDDRRQFEEKAREGLSGVSTSSLLFGDFTGSRTLGPVATSSAGRPQADDLKFGVSPNG